MAANTPSPDGPCYLGIDVGTGSARAGLFGSAGELIGVAARDIRIWREAGDIAEQSSHDIWNALSAAVREVVSTAGIDPARVAGIGFDATCSLVLVGPAGAPVSASNTGDPARNIIVWMDHRAKPQAERINATGHPVLAFVGGRISPEMETPKLLWLKENLPAAYQSASHFFDLTDYLTWRASGDLSRSVCTVTCKWTYLAHEARWDGDYFATVGLEELADDGFARIGARVVDPGTALGAGLTAAAAEELGLVPGIPVAAGLIDAHAGGVGTVGAAPGERMAYVFGTSACTMTSSEEKTFVAGVWGPYFSAMVPGLWLNEGGQSAAGEAIAHLIAMHPYASAAEAEARAEGLGLADYLLRRIADRIELPSDAIRLAGQMIVVPDFLGNRAPHADPSARGIVAGLDLRRGLDSLLGLYVAGVTGIGYGLRQILEAQRDEGLAQKMVVVSGGAGRHPLVKQLLADSAGIAMAEPGTAEPVLLGSAMLGAVAAGACGTVTEAMTAMSKLGAVREPETGPAAAKHSARYARFKALQSAARVNTMEA